MQDSRSKVFDDNSIEMASSSDAIADFSQVETTRRRSVSPTFLRALGLMKVTTKETTVTSVPLSESRGTKTDENVGGSHTSTSKELIRPHKKRFQSKSVAARSTTEKTFVVKEEHVSKSKDRAKKRSRATAFAKPKRKPAGVVKKTRKPAARATDKPTTKERQHNASPPATKVSSSAPKSTDKPAENLSEFTSAADEGMWRDIVNSGFKSDDCTMLLKKNQFTEEQIEAIQKSLQSLDRMFCRRQTIFERFMKTHECIECHYSISHECAAINSAQYWRFGGLTPSIDFIRPEIITMCLCNFTIFHSHNKVQQKSKREAKSPERSPLPRPFPLVEYNRSVNLECPWCHIIIKVSNRYKDACSDLMNFINVEGPIRKKFFGYIHDNLDFGPRNYPALSEFYSCRTLCCILFHRCARGVIVRNSMPIQPHPPIPCCHPSERM